MDIQELHDFKLGDAIKFHKKLNPKLWHDEHLDPEIRKQLLTIAKDFIDDLGVTLHVKDITISGSNAAFTYTPHSDLDLHVIVDMKRLPESDVYKELFNAKKTLYNENNDIKVRGIPVELYVQDSNEPVQSLGEYSLLRDKWIRIPKKQKANFDQLATKEKYKQLAKLVNLAMKTRDLARVSKAIDIVRRYRKAGLHTAGEFSPENLAYKAIRKQGGIDKLYDLRDRLHGQSLSIEEATDRPSAIAQIKQLQNTSGRTDNEIAASKRIIQNLMHKYNIRADELEPIRTSPLQKNLDKAKAEREAAAQSFKAELANMFKRFRSKKNKTGTYNRTGNINPEDLTGRNKDIFVETVKYNTKQQVIDHFVRLAKAHGLDVNLAARKGAAAWERGWRGPKPREAKPYDSARYTNVRLPYVDEGSKKLHRDFVVEYDLKKTAQAISNGTKAEEALIADRGDTYPMDQHRTWLLRLQSKARDALGGQKTSLIEDPKVRASFLEDLVKAIEAKDPTPNKQYTPWLARMYIKGGVKLEDLNRNNILGLFDLGKRRRMIGPEDADINRFKTYRDFEYTMLNKYELDDIDKDQQKDTEKAEASKVFSNSNLLVVVPHNQAAACKYGASTAWCTSATRGHNYFDNYNSRGPLYIIIPKDPTRSGEKYQLHFPTDQFMNEEDHSVSLYWLISKRFPELKDFFMEREPELKNYIEFAPNSVLEPLVNRIAELGLDYVYEVLTEWETNDSYYYEEMLKRYPDPDGLIDWDAVNDGEDDYLNWNYDAKVYLRDANLALALTPEKLKKWMEQDYYDSPDAYFDQGPGPSIKDLASVMAVRVRKEYGVTRRGNEDRGLAEFLDSLGVYRIGPDWQVLVPQRKT